MDAWAKGGTFEGQKATDELVLAHWRGRLKHVDKRDPLYDTYKNTITQYDYAIHESKVTAAYAQGRMNESQVAAFYLNWAKKVPKNSEFYRVLQRDAAQFTRAARAKGAAAAKAAAEAAYQSAQGATSKRYEAAGQYMTDVITTIAQSHALIGASGSTEDVRSFDPSDPSAILGLINSVNNAKAVVYHDPLTGKAVTGADILNKIRQLDPQFSGTLSLSYYSQSLRTQQNGQAIRLARATKTGHASDVNNIQQWQKYTAEIGREAHAWPIEKAYMDLRDIWQHTWNDPTASPEAKLQAWNVYAAGLSKLANDPKYPPDDNTKTRLLAEVAGSGKVDSLAESFTGLNGADHTTTVSGVTKGDISDTHIDVERFQQYHDDVAMGKSVWSQGTYDAKSNTFVPGKGNEIGAISMMEAQQAPASTVSVFIPQAGGLPPIQTLVAGMPVTAVVVDANGFSVPSASPNSETIATAYDVVINGQSVRMYKYRAADGRDLYTRDAPWANATGVTSHDTGNGVQLTVTLPVAVGADTKGIAGLTVTPPRGTGKPTITVDAGALIFSLDPARVKAGPDPLTDSFSPTMAALVGTTEGRNILNALSRDDDFIRNTEHYAQLSAGATGYDPATGLYTGADPAKLADAYSQSRRLTGNSAPENLLDGWDRRSTTPTFASAGPMGPQAGESPSVTQQSPITIGGFDSRYQSPKMPSDDVVGTQFGALGSIFGAGTNLLVPTGPMGPQGTGISIKTSGTITVPATPAPVAPLPTVTDSGAVIPVSPQMPPPPPPPPTAYSPRPGGADNTRNY